MEITLDVNYKELLTQLKDKIKSSQIRAALSVNYELIQLYWHIGQGILEKQEKAKWGSKFLASLSRDLQNAFPETRGFSVRNLEFMRQFATNFTDSAIAKQAVSQLPWGHIVVLMQRIKDKDIRDWYINQVIENNWSRPILEKKIAGKLYEKQGINEVKVSNYLTRLPEPQSGLAQDILKSPYNLDFLCLHEEAQEREIENELTKHITKFLLELGKGFAFLGRQVPIDVNGHEFIIDILLYHVHLHCYVIVELKAVPFKPEHAGQLNFYLTAADRHLKKEHDNPSIGILLCKSRDKILAEYALHGINKPIGVSEYDLIKAIPDKLKTSLPSIEELEEELNKN